MKKLTAIILTVIMLMTILPLNSFALFSKLPTVKSISFKTEDPIYYSELKKAFDAVLNYAEEEQRDPEDEELFYDICHHLNDYVVTLKFTDGTSLTLTEDYYECDDYEITIWAEVNLLEATEAYEHGATTVPVYVYANIYNNYKDYYSEKVTIDFAVAERYFKSIEYISGLPEEISENDNFLDLNGYKFKVTYVDGTEKTVVLEEDENYDFNIDNHYVSYDIDSDNKKVIFSCFDVECSVDINIIDYPFSNILITDTVHNFTTGILESIEYEIYMDDGSVKTFTAEGFEFITPDDPEDFPYAIIGQIEGYNIILINDVVIEETYPSTIYVFDSIEIEGTGIYDYIYSEYEDESKTNPIRAFLAKLVNAFYRLVDFIRNLFA